jgi:hypothetical protein
VLVGLALQLIGTTIAVNGLVKTWRAYSRDPIVPVWGRARGQLLGLKARAHALLLGPRHVRRHVADAITAVGEGVAYNATVIARDGLPADHGAAIAELDNRLRELMDKVSNVEHESRAMIDQVGSDLGLGLAEEASRRAAEDRAIATLGVTRALGGLACIFVGIGCQAAAVLWVLLSGPVGL